MVPLSTLKDIILSQKKTLPALGMPRDALLPVQKQFATILTGVRRCGKSTLLLQQVAANGPFHYLRFEDPRLVEFEPADFQTLQEAFSATTEDCSIYLLDEVQNVSSWEIFVRSLLDGGNTVYVTGSNATLLSRELGTRLTGRHLDYTLYPFSFAEYTRFTGKDDVLSYLEQGGFPEYLKSNNLQILQTLVDDILYRDIIARHSLRDVPLLQQVLLYLFSAIGSKITFQKIAKTLQAGSVTTISNYAGYLADAYLLFLVPKFDYSRRKQLAGPKKVYCVDTALAAHFSTIKTDQSHHLENVVYLHLRRTGYDVFYFQNNKECDFIATKRKEVLALQVTLELHDENREREIGGLLEAMKHLRLSEGMLLTLTQEDTIRIKDKIIRVLPIDKWLLSGGKE